MMTFFEKIQELIQQFAWEWGFIDLEAIVDCDGGVGPEWLSFLAYKDVEENGPDWLGGVYVIGFTGDWRFA